MSHDLEWIAVDWGTSHLRAWGLCVDGQVLRRGSSERGMGTLRADQFEAALIALIDDWLPAGRTVEVFACGMLGARQGWLEAPYVQVPCAPLTAERMVWPPLGDARIRVAIVPGLCQAEPADVMRGEETQIAGFLRDVPTYEGMLCLPGTHCKWVEVSAGRVIAFQTFITGELFALLLNQSVLRHGLRGDPDSPFDEQAFLAALDAGLAEPQRLLGALFGLRAQGLLHGLSAATGRARLSGWLIGQELAAARRLWQGRPVSVIGDGRLADLYIRALAAQGLNARVVSAAHTTLAGLGAARVRAGRALKGGA